MVKTLIQTCKLSNWLCAAVLLACRRAIWNGFNLQHQVRLTAHLVAETKICCMNCQVAYRQGRLCYLTSIRDATVLSCHFRDYITGSFCKATATSNLGGTKLYGYLAISD